MAATQSTADDEDNEANSEADDIDKNDRSVVGQLNHLAQGTASLPSPATDTVGYSKARFYKL